MPRLSIFSCGASAGLVGVFRGRMVTPERPSIGVSETVVTLLPVMLLDDAKLLPVVLLPVWLLLWPAAQAVVLFVLLLDWLVSARGTAVGGLQPLVLTVAIEPSTNAAAIMQ
ncbi:MAG: hypothetical protein AAFV88_19610 [Planctomycetota bacterium]